MLQPYKHHTVDITYNVIVKIEHLKEQVVMPLDSIFNFHWICIDKSHKRLSQKIKFVTTINEFLIDKFSPEREILLLQGRWNLISCE